jgi:gluconolactonase
MHQGVRGSVVAFLLITCFAVPLMAQAPKTIGKIERFDPAFDELVPKDAVIEVLAYEQYKWTEGPVWNKEGKYLLFSDIPNNRIMKWEKPGADPTVFLQPSGYTGEEAFTGVEPGTNGLVFDKEGRLVMCCHGDRLIRRMEPDGRFTVLADKYEGKRLNSPNDLVYNSNGDLYFTDPPYGLPKQDKDPGKELPFFGVYRLTPDGKLTLLTDKMTRPNGLAFSPDEKILYVAQSDPAAAIWNAFPVNEDGTLGEPKVFYDSTPDVNKMPGLPDGMTVDAKGNIWATGPGGVLVFNPEGKLLGRINTEVPTSNCKFGEDGSTLFITANHHLVRVRTSAKGVGF